ncbi:hypothetical protein MNBD_GAMMA18-819 [hydrothermal vent metagenome]|uniref:Uncharacterized protein n=1 Tax=hydrothermal vent metagenome TaxID=652676 RepID=A0A3B0ZFZ6_9ZZZZ
MGWKGTVRSIGAAVRAAERDAKRRQRELERQQKQYDKMQELEQAAYEVDVYKNHIDVIQSIHKECSDPIDWENISVSKGPKKPQKSRAFEREARSEFDKYTPGIIDKLFNREAKKRISLKENIERSVQKDTAEYSKNIATWESEVSDWEESVAIANSLLEGSEKAKIESIDSLNPFSEISNLGSNLTVSIGNNGIVEVTIYVHGDDIVPNEAKILLKSGKLSIKKMPKGRFNEIYQDYVCSCVLRVANEVFSTIPDKKVVVTAVDELLNPKTGHKEKSPILSVFVSRATLQSLNMEAIDPSDSMNNFVHNMSFKKIKGFEAVSSIDTKFLECV